MKSIQIFRKLIMQSFATTVMVIVASATSLAMDSYGQKTVSVKEVKLSMNFTNEKVESVFSRIEDLADYNFIFFGYDLKDKINVSGEYKDESLYNILIDISQQSNLNFKQIDKNINVKQGSAPEDKVEITLDGIDITGKVVEEGIGDPITGASVFIRGTTNGSVTDINGDFTISGLEAGNTYEVVISFVGFATQIRSISVSNANVSLGEIELAIDLLGLEEVVVTGSLNAKTKLESSVAITTLNSKTFEGMASTSTANYLQAIPGFLVETSAGEVGNNLFARGIPSAGAYEYVQIQEDGLPVFEDGALQFANIDNFQRADLTVERMEAVRGGSASILASGAPGGIINFISKTGQNEFDGVARLTIGDYGLMRKDLNIGGALKKNELFYNVGGFYRVDQGIRDTGYDANKGGQIKTNLSYHTDRGSVSVNFKYLNDRNVFYQSTPFVMDGGKPKAYSGFDPNYGTFSSVNYSKLRVPQGGGGYFTANLEDGVHPVSTAVGAVFHYDLTDKISVSNAIKNTVIDLNYNAIFAPHWMGDVSTQSQIAEANGVPVGDAAFTYADSGETLASGTELKRADYWYIHKYMRNLANNLSFNFDLDKVKLNVGYYYSNWSSDQNWNWSSFLVSASDNPRLVNLADANTGVEYTYNGISGMTWLQRESQIQNTINAFYADAEISINSRLTANVGMRYDSHQFAGVGDHGTWGNDIGVFPNNNADNGVNILQGDYVYWTYDLNELSYSAALNMKINDKMATYARYSRGFRTPIEESFYGPAVESRQGTAGLNDLEPTFVNQAEFGYKMSSSKVAVFASLFYMKLDNIAYQDIREGGVSEKKFANVQNIGLELEATAKLDDFSITFNGTLQDPQYKGYEGSESSLNGNLARRISNYFFTVRPAYSIGGNFNLYANVTHFGKKYQDIANTFELPAFTTVGAGASYDFNNATLALDATNLFNAIALTEADGRADGVAPVDGQTFMGRSILGRAVRLSVLINF